jgi:hypothetical protein
MISYDVILYVLPYTQGFFSRARHESLDECACRKIRQRVTEMVRRVEILYFNMAE